MSKHRLSPAPLPPPKRLHTLSPDPNQEKHSEPASTFDTVLYDELVLFIFSYLSPADLCTVQRTNRHWARLALDNQLWKSLYLNDYGRTRLRGVRGFVGRTDGREMRPLPGRTKSEDVKDWKWMYRISSNWRNGRCSVEPLDTGLERPSAPKAVVSSCSSSANNDIPYQTFVLLAGHLTISASSSPSPTPIITLTSSTHSLHTLRCPSSRSVSMSRITALALDQSSPSSPHHIRLSVFLSTGEYSIFSINHHNPAASSRILTYVPTTTPRTAPIAHAVYHHPLLVTLSRSFHLSFYDLTSDSPVHTQTLTSFTSFPPSSLVLSAPSPSTYKLVLAYAIPVYPAHWSVGATELMISYTPPSGSSSSSSRMSVSGTRTARTIDLPQGWMDETKLRAARAQWARKVARVADTQTDGKWVVLAPLDVSPSMPPAASGASSALQLYRLQLPSSSSTGSVMGTGTPKLTFVRTLHGQVGPVTALALADGRCVSLAANGSMWVWDLEGGTGAEVASGVMREGEQAEQAGQVKGTVVFDERRIISADADGVRVRRFDI